MPVYYVSNSRYVGSPDGSQANPFQSLWAAKIATGFDGLWVSDNTFRLWANDTFDDFINQPDNAAVQPNILTLGNNFIIEPWTDITNISKKPILTRAKRSFTWVFDSINGVWFSDALSNIKYGGVILEDGEPLNWKIWQTSRIVTASTMEPGDASFDNSTLQYLIKPRTGSPSSHIYAACAGQQNLKLIHANRFIIRAVEFQLSSQGILMGGGGFNELAGGWTVEDVDIRYCGASVDAPGAVALGNGFGVLHNVATYGTSYVKRTKAFDCFDSGFSPQIWEPGKIEHIEFTDCEAHRCGLTGFETSLTSNSGTFTNSIENVNFRRCLSKDMGKGFAGNRYGSTANGFSFLSNDNSANSRVTNCGLYDSRAIGCIGDGALMANPGGVITIKNNLFVSNGGAGVNPYAKAGYNAMSTIIVTENTIYKCGKGLKFGAHDSGKSALIRCTENLIEDCPIGISGELKPSDNATAESNIIVNCGTAIKHNGVGSLQSSENRLFGNALNFSGISSSSGVIWIDRPTINNESLYRSALSFSDYDGIYRYDNSEILSVENELYNIIRQYQNSPILSEIINKALANILPTADVEQLIEKVLNIYNAEGFALDIWGRIVGIDRSIPEPIAPVYFGFDGATGSEGFDIAPWGY